MQSYRRILCPVDASDCSRVALAGALSLAQRFDAVVEVLHVYQVPAHVPPTILVWAAVGPRPLWELAEEQARSELDRLLADVDAGQRSRLEVSLEVGAAATTILERARRTKPDLLVMGTHGRTGARRFVLGSVAERVVRLAPCPVLVIPMGQPSEPRASEGART